MPRHTLISNLYAGDMFAAYLASYLNILTPFMWLVEDALVLSPVTGLGMGGRGVRKVQDPNTKLQRRSKVQTGAETANEGVGVSAPNGLARGS